MAHKFVYHSTKGSETCVPLNSRLKDRLKTCIENNQEERRVCMLSAVLALTVLDDKFPTQQLLEIPYRGISSKASV